jgi:hypothetical protein
MHHPFYDPSDLSDQQLNEKLMSLMEKKNHASRMNMQTLVNNIDMLMSEIHMEQEKRSIDSEKDYAKRNNIDLNKPITLGEVEEIENPKDK